MFIARELRQPVATVRNYVQGLRRTLVLRGALKADVAEKSLLRVLFLETFQSFVLSYGKVESPAMNDVRKYRVLLILHAVSFPFISKLISSLNSL